MPIKHLSSLKKVPRKLLGLWRVSIHPKNKSIFSATLLLISSKKIDLSQVILEGKIMILLETIILVNWKDSDKNQNLKELKLLVKIHSSISKFSNSSNISKLNRSKVLSKWSIDWESFSKHSIFCYKKMWT